MSRRPMFWIHRTRLFWFGLGVLVVMVVMLVMSCGRSYGLQHWRKVNRLSRPGDVLQTLEAGLEGGGVFVSLEESLPWFSSPGRASFLSRWAFDTGSHPELDFWPQWDSVRDTDYKSFRLFVPVWPFIMAWCFLWPWWMHRSEKKMVERYQKLGGSGEGG